MGKVVCPRCKTSDQVQLKSPDYGQGACFKCYACSKYGDGYPFVDTSPEARAESDASRSLSAANAEEIRRRGGL